MPIKRHQELRVWQEAIALAVDVSALVAPFERGPHGALADQLRRAARTVHAGIAEGFARRTAADRSHYYMVAARSLAEVESHLVEALLTARAAPAGVRACESRIRHVARLLTAFRRGVR